MQYQHVIRMLFWRFLRVILPSNQRCIKGTFNCILLYIERAHEHDNATQKKPIKTGRNTISKRTQYG